MEKFTIPKQFCGPPSSGNGGYFCGTVASFFEHSVEIRLKAPPPLDTPMQIERGQELSQVFVGDTLIAQVRPLLENIEPAPWINRDDATDCSDKGLAGSLINHPFPTCFVCGPNRHEGDGMRVFTGPQKDTNLFGARWHAHPAWSSNGTTIDPKYVWSALDCPSSGPAFATSVEAGSDIAYVLGTLSVQIHRDVKVGEDYSIVCATDERHERLYRTRVSLYGLDQEPLATGAAVWIQVPRSMFQGA